MSNRVDNILEVVKSTVVFSPPVFTFAGFTLEEWMYWVSITAGVFLVLERVPRVITSWKDMWRRKENGSTSDKG